MSTVQGLMHHTLSAASCITMDDDLTMFGDPPIGDSDVGGILATAVTTSDRSFLRLSMRFAMELNLVHGCRGLLSLVEVKVTF